MKHLKLFESKENYKVIATNDSYYSWEYDSSHAHAEILLDENDDSLYLKITNSHTKTGLGAGTFKKPGEFVKIGDLNKANLTMVRDLLKKHQYDQSKFKRFWEDEEGNKMSLTDLLKELKPEKPALKHIKSITSFEEPIIPKNIELVKYSERAYALFGENTKDIKDKLMKLGCKYNKFLTDPSTGQKRPGWIFPATKLEKIKELL
jgi:hypothetical protein